MKEKKFSKDDIFEILKKRIVTLEYEPGKILNEVELSEEFDVSRTPIRQVFQQLQNISLVHIVPRYGVQVAPLNFLNIKSLFEVTKVENEYKVGRVIENKFNNMVMIERI